MLKVAGAQRVMDADDIIVSKTNPKGHIVYANDVFLDIADFAAREVLGGPHSIVRNDAMINDAFVREVELAMAAVSGGRYYRKIRPEGMRGAFLKGVSGINKPSTPWLRGKR